MKRILIGLCVLSCSIVKAYNLDDFPFEDVTKVKKMYVNFARIWNQSTTDQRSLQINQLKQFIYLMGQAFFLNSNFIAERSKVSSLINLLARPDILHSTLPPRLDEVDSTSR